MGFTFDPLVFSGLVPSAAAGGDVHWKAPVANAAALPLTGNSPGDIRVTLDTGNIWEWNGTMWFLPAIPYNEKGVANGVATLDGGGHIPLSQLPASIVEYKGVWLASTNTPTLADGVGISGWFYIVGDNGTVDFGSGPIQFFTGDWVLYNGTIWERADNFTGYANAFLSNLLAPTAVNQDLNMTTHAIKGMANPVAAQDAATKSYVDTQDALKANVTLNNLTSVSINQHTFEFDASAGTVNVQTAANPGGSNTIQIVSGNASGGLSGDVNLETGSAGGATTGSINLHTFNSASNNSGSVNLSTGSAGTTSGSVNISTGAGSFSRGNISLNGASVNVNTSQIHNVVDPTSAQDAATKNYIDTGFANRALSNLTTTSINTDLIPSGDESHELGSSAHRWDSFYGNTASVDVFTDSTGNIGGTISVQASFDLAGNAIVNLVDPTNPQDAATKNYVDILDAANFQKDGSRAATGDFNLNTHQIHNVVDPTSPQDAATKNYVDSSLSGTANTVTFYNGSGAIGSSPQLSYDSVNDNLVMTNDPASVSMSGSNNFIVSHILAGGTVTASGNGNVILGIAYDGASGGNLTATNYGSKIIGTSYDGQMHSTGIGSIAMGIAYAGISGSANNHATGDGSITLGAAVTGGELAATGFGSMASGVASNNNSKIISSGTGSFNSGLVDSGDTSTVSSDGGFGFGRGFSNNSYHTAMFGRYPNAAASNPTTWVATDPLFVLGNGSSTGARHNAFQVDKNGTIHITDPGSANNISVKAPSLPGNWTLQLPPNDGNPSDVLTTDGSGITTWTPIPSPSPTGTANTIAFFDNSGALTSDATELKFTQSNSGFIHAFPSGNTPVASANGTMVSGFIGGGGSRLEASGDGAHAFGYANDGVLIASGKGAFVAGIGYAGDGTPGLTASGDGCIALGFGVDGGTLLASGDGSFVTGLALNPGSTMTSSGEGSFVGGYVSGGDDLLGSGDGSFTFGRGHSNQVLNAAYFGRYAVASPNSPTTWNATDPLLVLGNGTSQGARHNAFQVDKNGTVHFTDPASANSISTKAPSLSSSWTLTLPPNDGNPNDVLTTDGSGVTTWQPPASPTLAKASYYTTAAPTIDSSGPLITFPTMVVDTASAFNTGTGVYTIPTTGLYYISYKIVTTNTAWTQGNVLQINIDQNGSTSRALGTTDSAAGTGSYYRNMITEGIFVCVAGDAIQFNAYSDISSSLAPFANSNIFSIFQLS